MLPASRNKSETMTTAQEKIARRVEEVKKKCDHSLGVRFLC